MSCGNAAPTYRLLDGYVGWSADAGASTMAALAGLDDLDGLRLKDPYYDRVPADVLTPYLPPPWLARGCGPCTWFLIDPAQPPALRQRDPCGMEPWIDLTHRLAAAEEATGPIALSAHGGWLAAADAPSARVFVWSVPDGRLVACFSVPQPGPLAFASWGEWIVASGPSALRRFGISGAPIGAAVTLDAPIRRLGRGNDGALYAALGAADGPFEMVRITLAQPAVPAGAAPLCSEAPSLHVDADTSSAWLGALLKTDLLTADAQGFCLEEPDDDGAPARRCFGRDGKPLSADAFTPDEPQVPERTATFETAWLDSGIPRCRWHRVRVDVEIPARASVKLKVVTNEEKLAAVDAGDWEEIVLPDGLVQKPVAGRHLKVRIELSGQAATPVVHRVRLDFPRSTSLDRLPPVYRDNPLAEDFTERFLALFDATLGDLDADVTSFTPFLDASQSPQEALAWLAGMLGVRLDPAWDEQRVRAIVRALPGLYAQRGTPAGLTEAIRLLFDLEPAIVDHGAERPWSAVDSATLGGFRLFGANTARFRLNRSLLGSTPLTSYGDPDRDPFRTVAHRFTVLVPSLGSDAADEVQRLDRLIQTQKPAHTSHTLRVGGDGFVLGMQTAVGIDTQFVAPGPAVLGRHDPPLPGTFRLNARVALRSGFRRPAHGLQVGLAVVGRATVWE